MDRPTFSPFWHRIRALRPRLRPHVQITRQHYRGKRWHVVHDPTSNQFYRLNPIAHDLVATMDGSRSVEDAWKQCLAKFGDAAPTQNEVLELLGQLYNSNLLSMDSTPETEQLLRRGKERTKKRIAQQAIGLMYFRLKLFNPDTILTFLEPLFRPVLNRWGLLAWAILVLYALATVLSVDPSRITAGLDAVVAPGNWGYLSLVFILLKGWHELGHGIICKRFGGQVPEFGVMLLVLLPAPFVDASSCWAFPSKYQRMAVGAGGMIFELFIASIAALVWVSSADGSLTKQICYFIMFTSGVSTVIFNANPLMRFDGYFILSDLIEVPNLMSRSNRMLQYLFQRYIYGVKQARSPSSLPGERALLIVYGVLGMAYRVFLFLVITLYVLGLWFIVGVLLAAWTFAMWFFIPVGKFIHWLATSSQLMDHRPRAIATSLALIALAAVLIGVVPAPDWRRARGVVDSEQRSGVYIGTDGFVETAHVGPGDLVAEGDPILTLSSPELEAHRRAAIAQLAELQVERSQAFSKDDPASAAVAQRQAEAVAQQIADIERRSQLLVVRAPHAGTIVGADPKRLVGEYMQQGKPVCIVADTTRLRVTALLPQTDAAWLFELPQNQIRVAMRLVSDPWRTIGVQSVHAIPGGQRNLPHSAMAFMGGGDIETAGNDPSGRTAKADLFDVNLGVDPGELAGAALGQRVYLRFALPSKSVLEQVIDRIQKTLHGRVNL